MIQSNLSILARQAVKDGRGLWLTVAALVLALAAISCGTVTRSVVLLPEVPGAKYIGSKECEQCHEDLCREFATADHARLIAAGTNAINAGCEACHGPCSIHSDSGGETLPRARSAFAGMTRVCRCLWRRSRPSWRSAGHRDNLSGYRFPPARFFVQGSLHRQRGLCLVHKD
jgi:hypothetical protein